MEPIRTQRLILRNFRAEDLDDLHAYLSDPEVVRFEPYAPMTREETAENLKWRVTTDEMIAMERISDGRVIGNIYLGAREFNSLELGYVMNRAYWGMGYAKEAATAVIRRAFEEGAHRVYAECDPDNPNSWHLLEALGFRREAYLKQNCFFHRDAFGLPLWKDTYIYAKLEDE